jgi:hypothetical protein
MWKTPSARSSCAPAASRPTAACTAGQNVPVPNDATGTNIMSSHSRSANVTSTIPTPTASEPNRQSVCREVRSASQPIPSVVRM